MKRIFLSLLILLLFLDGFAQTSESYKTIKDIPYRTSSSDNYITERCKLDVYYPADVTNFPTVVWFHGGGLSGGSKFIPAELLNSGLGVIAVNYRLLPKCDFTDCIDDAAAAVAWAFNEIEKYGGDKKKIFVSGHSAGGYLTNMIGLDKRWLKKYNIEADSIAALVPFSGHAISHFAYRQSKGMKETQPSIDEYAPLFYVRPDAPPMIIVSGDRELEMLGRYEENAYFWRMMKVAGHKEVYLYELDGYDHGAMASPAFHILKNHIKDIIKTSGNPLFPGWYADPEGIIYDDTYWIYPTYSDKYEKQTFFDCFSSKDLVNWKKHSSILNNDEVKWANKAMWAPSVIRKDNKYYLFFGANDVHEGEIGGIGVAVSDKPEGPYKDLLGKPLINEIVNGAQPIDQFVFRDDDGTYYMYYGGWKHCNITKLNSDFTALVPFEDGSLYKEVTPENYVEGPFMLKRGGKYYFMWSEGGWTGPDYSVAYAISDSPFGPFKRIGTILKQDDKIANGAGHHSVMQVPGTEDYYIVYHRRPLTETHGNHRETCIEKLYFNPDGTIRPVIMTLEGVKAQKIVK